jgi:[Skp1-protein]-hydroxyproline N-acetylglucosaminyltransferase
MTTCPISTIFVSVASYRDSECPTTVYSAFQKADHPCRIFVGICQQNSQGDLDCLTFNRGHIPLGQVRILRLDSKEARGPVYARQRIAEELTRDETFFLQIDSHTRFVQGWDTKLIEMTEKLESLGVNKYILSHYPKHFDPDDANDMDPEVQDSDLSAVPVICKSFFNERNMISFEGAQFLSSSEIPRPNAYIAAGMLFTRMSAIKEVPFPKDLDGLFVGEEILMSVRYWTHGYDIFTPSSNTVYHYYTRNKGEPKFWSLKLDDNEAHEKVKKMLHFQDVNNTFGLGTARTLQQYYEWTGIEPSKRMVEKSFCELPSVKITSTTPIPISKNSMSNIIPIVVILLILMGFFWLNKN